MTDNKRPTDPDSAARRRKMIQHLSEACRLAALEGVTNLFRSPGLVQQLVVSDALGHVPCLSWHDGEGDAYAAVNPKHRFEYFSAGDGRRFQTGTAGEGGRSSREKLRLRILAVQKVYLAVFDVKKPLTLLRIYEVEPEVMWEEAARQIDKSAKSRANVSVTERWAAKHGRKVFPKAAAAEAAGES